MRLGAGARMGAGDQAAQVRVAGAGGSEQREVEGLAVAVARRQLAAGDGLQAELVHRVCKGERPTQVVVIGQRDGAIPERRRPRRQLLGLRSSVEKRVGAMGVQLRVHERMFAQNPIASDSKRVLARR